MLELEFESPTNTSEVYAAFTKAGDYATIRCAIDDGELGPPIDLYAADVVNSGGLVGQGPIDGGQASAQGCRHGQERESRSILLCRA